LVFIFSADSFAGADYRNELAMQKEKLIKSDYSKLKENNAPSKIVDKYAKIMTKSGIDLSTETSLKNTN